MYTDKPEDNAQQPADGAAAQAEQPIRIYPRDVSSMSSICLSLIDAFLPFSAG